MSSPLVLTATLASGANTRTAPSDSTQHNTDISPNSPFAGLLQVYSHLQQNTELPAQELTKAVKALVAGKKLTPDDAIESPHVTQTNKPEDTPQAVIDDNSDNEKEGALPLLALQILHEAKALQPSSLPKTDHTKALAAPDLPLARAIDKHAAAQPVNSTTIRPDFEPDLANTPSNNKKTVPSASKEPSTKPLAPSLINVSANSSLPATNSQQSTNVSAEQVVLQTSAAPEPIASHPALNAQTNNAISTTPVTPPSAAPIQDAINLQKPGWTQQLGQHFIKLVTQDNHSWQSAEIRLDPPELGPLRISLHVQDGIAHALISSPHALVRQTIEQSLSQLQQQLADNGLSLGQANVSDQSNTEQFQQSLAEFAQQTGQRNSMSVGAASTQPAEQVALTPQRTLAVDALVDTYA